MQIADRSAVTAQQGMIGNALTDIIRARVGQFTFAGRMLTAGRRIFTASSNRLLARALLNPDSLKDLIALRKLSKTSKATAVILSKLGASNFLVQDDRAPVPPKEAVIEQDSNIDEIIGTVENELPETGDTSQLPVSQLQTPPLETPGINPASFDKTIMAQGTVDQTGLTSSELAFLDDEEKAMRLNQRGMA